MKQMNMGPLELLSTTLIITALFTSVRAQCTPQDLNLRLQTCTETANKIINSNQCRDLAVAVTSVIDCYSGCPDVPANFVADLDKLKKSINTAVMSRCADSAGPVNARDGGPASACDITTVFNCITNLGGVIAIPTSGVDVSSVKGVCGSIGTVTNFLNTCGVLVTDCVALGNVFPNELNQIRYGIRIGNELSNGGCKCASDIETSVQAFANLPQNKETLELICPVVIAASQATRTVLDQCINRLNTAVGGPTMDWLAITINAINVINPFILFSCGSSAVVNGAAVIGLGLLTAIAAALTHWYVRRMRT